MAATFTGIYEFSYTTPTQETDASGNPVTVQVPSSFSLANITEDVARGLRAGLRKVPSITNVFLRRVMQDREAVNADPTP